MGSDAVSDMKYTKMELDACQGHASKHDITVHDAIANRLYTVRCVWIFRPNGFCKLCRII